MATFKRWMSILGLCTALCTSTALPSPSEQNNTRLTGTTILYHNSGDWTGHGGNPSLILFNEPATYHDAVKTCDSYNETLFDCRGLYYYEGELEYQAWLGTFNGSEGLWTSCDSSRPSDFQGRILDAETQSAAGGEYKYAFLCTNKAPFVGKVDTDYSTFPTVRTPAIEGVAFEGLRDHMAYRFLGIPFAIPPVGDLRFQYAQPPEYQNGSVVNATRYREACMQVGSFEGNADGLNPWGNSEDCLHLQVFTPTLPSTLPTSSRGLKPVMLWIHGGAMINGAGSDSTFDGASLVSRGDVVLVSINYRLNIFGLLTLNDGVVNGNYALSDKVAALEWVQKYIRAFGGDPDNVTIFGQSAGGASVMDLIVSPKAKGLFKNAIPQSLAGNVVNQSVIEVAMAPYIEPLCPASAGQEGRLECLRQLPAETLLNISTEYWSWSTVVDGVYMVDQPLSLVAEGKTNNVNVLMGWMPEEAQSLLSTSIAPNMTNLTAGLDALVEGGIITSSQASTLSSSGLWDVPQNYTNAYNATINIGTDGEIICHVLEFVDASTSTNFNPFKSLWLYTHQRAYVLSFYSFYDLCTFPVNEPNTPYYRCHSGDLYEVFGTYYLFNQPVRVYGDIAYTNAVQDMWTSFAKTGNPNPDPKYLRVREYGSSSDFFASFKFEEYSAAGKVMNLQWPRSWSSGLPDQEHCRVLNMTFEK